MREAFFLLVLGGGLGLAVAACGSEPTSGAAAFANDGGGGGDSGPGPGPGPGNDDAGGGDDAGSTDGASGRDTSGDPPYAIAFSGPSPFGVDARTPVDATFATNGALDSFTAGPDEAPQRGTGAVYEVFKDALAGTGRWTDGQPGGTFHGMPPFLNGSQGFHYAFVMRPPAVPAPIAAAYTLGAATKATIDDGSLPTGTFTGNVATVIDGASMRVGVSFSITMPSDGTYAVTTAGGTAAPASSPIVANAQDLAFGGTAAVTGTGVACQGGSACTATIRAVRSAGNDRLAIAFAVTSGGTKQLRGAAVFKKN